MFSGNSNFQILMQEDMKQRGESNCKKNPKAMNPIF